MAIHACTPATGGENYIEPSKRDGGQSVVYFTRDLSADGLRKAFAKVAPKLSGKVAIKLHTGEKDGPNIIPRPWVAELVEKDLPDAVIVETNTYYEGSRYTTEYLLDTLRLTYRLPGCSKKFPRDVGRERPCLNFQMGNCDGWCRPEKTQEEYAAVFSQVLQVLRGDYRALAQLLRERMEQAAEAMEFERAAQLRDRLRAIEALGKKQLVTARSGVETDAVGYAGSGVHACFSVLHYVGGALVDKDYEIVEPAEREAEAR